MLSGISGKYFSAVMLLLLCSFSVPLSAQTEAPPSPSRDIQQGMVTVMSENKEYAAVKANADSIRTQIETLQEKLIAQNPELKKLFDERQTLQKTIIEATRANKPETEILPSRNRLREVTWQLEKIFSGSAEYVRLAMKLNAALAKMNWTFQKVLATSSDPRVLKFIETMEKTVGDYIAYSARNLPKADVKGTDEYKAAIAGIEKYRQDPARYKTMMEQCCNPLRQKMEWCAGKDPAIREMNRKLSLTRTELFWRKALLEEKNPELTWKVRTFPTSPDFRAPEGIKKYNAMNKELVQAIQSDPEYSKLEKMEQNLRKEHRKALDGFAAKSSAPEAVEFRKALALLEEVNKTVPSGKTK